MLLISGVSDILNFTSFSDVLLLLVLDFNDCVIYRSKTILPLDSLWIHQSTMRQTDMRNRKQKHGNTYSRHVPVLAKSLCVLVMPAFQQHVSAITVRNPEDSIAAKCA